MKGTVKILGVIPARGGSKGVPRKNIAMLNNKPLISYAIESALESKLLTDVVVSTEDNEIADVSIQYGAKVPFKRPDNLATDKALSLPVIQHAVIEMEKLKEIKYDLVMMLQPTTPFRTSEDIDNSIELLANSDSESLVSVVDVEGHHPFRIKRIVDDNLLINFIDQGFEDMRPRQELPKVYIRSGAIYLAKRDLIMEENTFVSIKCKAYVLPQERSINIDTKMDFLLADAILKNELN